MAISQDLSNVDRPVDPTIHEVPTGRYVILRNLASNARFEFGSDLAAKPVQDAGRYVREIGLVAQSGPTPAGRLLLKFHGREAVRWLVACEFANATGPMDAWRCSREIGAYFLRTERAGWVVGSESEPHFHWSTVQRWVDFGALKDLWDGGDGYGFEVTSVGRDILSELAGGESAPLLDLARSLAADASAESLRSVDERAAKAAADTVEQATVRHARVVAHELRNKLVPLQTAVEILALAAPAHDARTTKAAALARSAVAGLFSFVDTTVELAKALRQPHGWFHILTAVQDAVSAGRNGSENVSVNLHDRLNHLDLFGPRQQVVLAIGNLVRNAAQAAGGRPLGVSIGLRARDSRWSLTVEDDGPGIPAALRGRVFDSGYSTKPGGLGMGLDFVRSVVERELEGTVAIEEAAPIGCIVVLDLPAERFRPAKTPSVLLPQLADAGKEPLT